jgi:hypothetical protein
MNGEPNDILRAAARALREDSASPASAARFTRLRVMASLRESEVRRRTQTVLLLPFAACLAVASAWGMAVGTITEMREAVTRALGIDAPPPAPSATPPEKRRAPRAVKAPSPAPSPVTPPVDPEPELAPAPPPSAEAPAPPEPPKALSNSVVPPRRPRPLPPDPAHELYRAAHDAHFVANDWSAALSGWDAYLRAAPRGRLSPEARYNRALCLVRLGRTAEARVALEPFARGTSGSYRQREASELLGVLAEN